jgi:diacylglycerol kinase (ATP)
VTANFKNIHVIINPAAGGDVPVLATLNSVFQEAGVEWSVSITQKQGDGQRLAKAAVAQGVEVVAAYGGDGTVAEVASGLIGTNMPFAILPGGTANVLSLELGIPADLAQAAALACGMAATLRPIDAGQICGQHFLLRAGLGFEAAMIEQADRNLKDRYGMLAYWWSAMQNLRQPQIFEYHLTLDGKQVTSRGITCGIANAANLGVGGINFGSAINISDGLLDVLVIEEVSWRALFDVLSRTWGKTEAKTTVDMANMGALEETFQEAVHHWQARDITIDVSPLQTIQFDGEVFKPTTAPIEVQVLPQAISVLVPPAATTK